MNTYFVLVLIQIGNELLSSGSHAGFPVLFSLHSPLAFSHLKCRVLFQHRGGEEAIGVAPEARRSVEVAFWCRGWRGCRGVNTGGEWIVHGEFNGLDVFSIHRTHTHTHTHALSCLFLSLTRTLALLLSLALSLIHIHPHTHTHTYLSVSSLLPTFLVVHLLGLPENRRTGADHFTRVHIPQLVLDTVGRMAVRRRLCLCVFVCVCVW